EPLADLVAPDRRVGFRPGLPIHRAVIKPLILERLLHGLRLVIRPGGWRKRQRGQEQKQKSASHRYPHSTTQACVAPFNRDANPPAARRWQAAPCRRG